jgi:hypothetical protein
LQRTDQTHVKIETAVDEEVLMPVQKQSIIHEYGEPLEARIHVYALEEIVAEKLRAIFQHTEILHQRGWARSMARDYYDIWRVLGAYENKLQLSGFSSFLQAKCTIRNVSFSGPADFFDEATLSYVERTWAQWLGPLVPDLPGFTMVIDQLQPRITSLLSYQ